MVDYENTDALLREVNSGLQKFGPYRTAHEAYAVILEEMDELWDSIKDNNPDPRRSLTGRRSSLETVYTTGKHSPNRQ